MIATKRRVLAVALAEQPAALQRYVHGLEVTGRDNAVVRVVIKMRINW